jgi:hypothetical protein
VQAYRYNYSLDHPQRTARIQRHSNIRDAFHSDSDQSIGSPDLAIISRSAIPSLRHPWHCGGTLGAIQRKSPRLASYDLRCASKRDNQKRLAFVSVPSFHRIKTTAENTPHTTSFDETPVAWHGKHIANTYQTYKPDSDQGGKRCTSCLCTDPTRDLGLLALLFPCT